MQKLLILRPFTFSASRLKISDSRQNQFIRHDCDKLITACPTLYDASLRNTGFPARTPPVFWFQLPVHNGKNACYRTETILTQ